MDRKRPNSDTKFGIYIHHGGHFAQIGDDRVYHGGDLLSALNLDSDGFGYNDLEFEIEMIGYVSWNRLAYKVPRSETYYDVNCDEEVSQMLSHISDDVRVFHVFVDGGKLGTGEDEDDDEDEDEDKGLEKEELVNGGFGESSRVASGLDEWQDFDPNDLVDVDQVLANEDGLESNKEKGKVQEDENLKDKHKLKGVSAYYEIVDDYISEEDEDYIQDESNSTDYDYSDDDLEDELLEGDDEYTNARKMLRDKSHTGLCDDLFINVGGECGFSDYEDQDGDVMSDETDEDEDEPRLKRKIKRVVYDPRDDIKNTKLSIGMRFDDGFQARDVIKEVVIAEMRQICFRGVSKTQLRAKCTDPCKWRVYGSLVNSTGHFIIKTLHDTHTCGTTVRNKQVTSSWIAKTYLNVFRYKPDITARELAMDLLNRYKCHVIKWKLYKARSKAIDMLRGTVEAHYAKLRNYVMELMRADPEGRFEIHTDVGAVFKGLYVGFSALKKGFKAGCRRVIGVDGAFLKTYLGGVLLCAVATDANNGMYPIAWGVVEIENIVNWRWFLRILFDDLGLSTGAGITVISDQQKGLLNAVGEVAPLATHRNCVRHVYINWKKSHKGITLRNLFWRAVRATYLQEYNAALDAMKKENLQAYNNFIGRDTTKFCKCFIDPGSSSDMILNNISETFNGYILTARSKHLIDMLEEIRISIMGRLQRKKSEFVGYHHRICPEIFKKVEAIKKSSSYCMCHASSDVLFEVENYSDRFIVDVLHRTCSCREWDISGIPCIHAMSAIHFLRGDPQNYVSEWYTVEKHEASYQFGLPPLNGEKLWPRAEGFPISPPVAKKMPGRPKKKRKKNPCEEDSKNPHKLRKNGVLMTCSDCHQQGHNKRTCKNEKVSKDVIPKKKAGRPRKVAGEASTSRQQKAATTSTTGEAASTSMHSAVVNTQESQPNSQKEKKKKKKVINTHESRN